MRKRGRSRIAWWSGALLALGVAGLAAAGDGRIEISQAQVVAGGGFPFVIATPGSYVLTSDLVVSATDVPAIRIDANEVALDLNGFRVVGPGSGTADGIQSNGRRVSVANGLVRSFGGAGVRLALQSRAEGLIVYGHGGGGIVTGSQSLVLRCQAFDNGDVGLSLGQDTAFHDNVLANNTAGDVTGGSATGGNACDDGSCLREGRRYYLTLGGYKGDQVLTACDAGFHTASIYEVWDFDALRYDTVRGMLFAGYDAGSGPYVGVSGWMRTGLFANHQAAVYQGPNCDAWTQATTGEGLLVSLRPPLDVEATGGHPWLLLSITCSTSQRVWCVED